MDSVRSPDRPAAGPTLYGTPRGRGTATVYDGPPDREGRPAPATPAGVAGPARTAAPATPPDQKASPGGYAPSSTGVPRTTAPLPVKIIIAGGFGVGKTTTVGAISEIDPLTTEAEMTSAGIGVDDPGGRSTKTTTTVAMDFGCVTIDHTMKLYLFGTPGQARFGFMWDDLARGALGALVVVDSARLDDCYPAVDYFERAQLPFIVAVNAFDGRVAHELDHIRWALAIGQHVPLVAFDARDKLSVRDTLLVLLNKALDRATQERTAT